MREFIFFVPILFMVVSNCVEAKERGSKKAKNAGQLSFCVALYGSKSELLLDPYEANGWGVAGSKKILPKDTPKPTAFRCTIVSPLAGGSVKCPEGMNEKKQATGGNSCVSKEFPICKLCPEEIGHIRPDLKETFCKSQCS